MTRALRAGSGPGQNRRAVHGPLRRRGRGRQVGLAGENSEKGPGNARRRVPGVPPLAQGYSAGWARAGSWSTRLQEPSGGVEIARGCPDTAFHVDGVSARHLDSDLRNFGEGGPMQRDAVNRAARIGVLVERRDLLAPRGGRLEAGVERAQGMLACPFVNFALSSSVPLETAQLLVSVTSATDSRSSAQAMT